MDTPKPSHVAQSARTAKPPRMKSFTDLFIRRPVLAMVVSLIILIAGLQAIRSLNVRQYPRSENATVTVTTVYVGASANLVRGFVTQPLERAIAAADGIDYMESASKLGLSTITVHLRLNYDSKKALGEISSKVDQVRNDLPPEAEIPTLTIATADSQFASAYLSFSSDILEANQITDYLDARRAAAADRAGRRAEGGHSGRPHVCHAHLAQARPARGLQHQPERSAPGAGGEQFSFRRRPHQRLARPGQPDGEHGFALAWTNSKISSSAGTATGWCG